MISDHRYKNRFHVFFLMVCMGGFVILQTVYDLGGTLVGITLLFTDHLPIVVQLSRQKSKLFIMN